MNKQIQKLMETLQISRAEAIEVIEADKRIDRGEKLFELSEEQKRAERKLKNVDVKTVYTFQKRERKADNDKRMIINYLQSTLKNWFQSNSQCTYNACTNFEIVNPEREFLFTYNGKKYKVVLSAPRS